MRREGGEASCLPWLLPAGLEKSFLPYRAPQAKGEARESQHSRGNSWKAAICVPGSSYQPLCLAEKAGGGSLGCVFPLGRGEKELSWGKKVPFAIAVLCVHLRALTRASKMGFFFPFLPWSSFTCSARGTFPPAQPLPFSCPPWVLHSYLTPRD